ncbi:MAG: tRNA (guanosine(37)-N1)-methyltransferase TrmD [Spirochaetales bacterium]|nr:tRNA (guanosine(37)-N1)-methyltransferase TrmD [Spirochaetales bacterium]
MNIQVLTLFPEMVRPYFSSSIMKRAVERNLVRYNIVNVRDFAADKHKSCDDAPYGGGAGMVMKPEPLAGALDSVEAGRKRTIFPTPSGRIFDQRYAGELAGESDLVFICGHYEGIDQRIIDLYVDDEITIGDYVLSSGEVASLAIIDTVYRLLSGVISDESLTEESFTDGSLEYPHYTRPEIFRGMRVPEVLLSGHHERIRAWRREQGREKTVRVRPDLVE